MVGDEQVRRLKRYMKKDGVIWKAASKAGMSEKTARRYLKSGKLPSQMKSEHTWRTRSDPFEGVWSEVEEKLRSSEGMFEAKTLFEELQRFHPGVFQDGQLRTLQRRIKVWRATEGPGKEVYFDQVHEPGRLCQSDFTHMDKLRITICGQPFSHLVYHFVLTYSNWETGTVCFGENYESLSQGLQNALWELGGVPQEHQTDQLTAAVHQLGPEEKEGFTQRYRGLLAHYGLVGRKTQAASPNENGDVEQRHHRFQRGLEQALLLRGSRDFVSREEYEDFLRELFKRLNAGRRERFLEEAKVLRALPACRTEDSRKEQVKVGIGSTIRAGRNTYSVPSRLIGEWVEARLYADHVEVWYGQRCVEKMPRVKGRGNHRIEYRHIIESLVRKPGAFENYRYHSDLFPTSHFRMAYDQLKEEQPARASKEYLKILELAALEGESLVDEALRFLMGAGGGITAEKVTALAKNGEEIPPVTEIAVEDVDLGAYDDLLAEAGESCTWEASAAFLEEAFA
jgi:transposase